MFIRRARWGIVGLVVAVAPLGCGGSAGGHAAPAVAIPGPAGDTAPADAPAGPPPAPKAVAFTEAVSEDSPEEQLPPPDQTLNGYSTGKVRMAVQKAWHTIAFTTPAGKKLAYTAVVDTEFGTVKIALRPDVAPNHVRNFVALARAGFYDGLVFERVIEQEGDGPESKLELVEGGCPLGTGEPGIGHLGYWLYPEFSDTKHEAGTVGACLNGAEDTAGCRFYVTLSSAPAMDGNFTVFGKVTTGLDVVRTIAKQPRTEGSPRPDRPAMIRKVTIQTREVD
jgi:cyclophilin family peptidyl-prolyl cis-trans isomerase